ncbi:hypothetical protein BT63DRAFT_428579 [Microthyrium microscopicum]|uniref:Autophagy-related protein 11 n=1 Tax=Microthyrium microscopicum TaxID=703497 RepID=A0A6A6TZW0_9PEZI|nr:hypothetical protein BT63DRAFT_428579 [Microthyrium microscopicum]
MSIQIYAIPSGDSLQVPQPAPTSLDDLRAWIERAFNIPAEDQILLTNKGKPLRLQNFLTENEIFLFDRVLFSPTGTALDNVNLTPLPTPFNPEPFPDTLLDSKSLKAWQILFKERREWANDLLARCKALQQDAEGLLSQRIVVEHGIRLATTSIEGPIKSIEKKLSDFQNGLLETSRDTTAKANVIDVNLDKLNSVPALETFQKFFVQGPGKGTKRKSVGGTTTLAAFVDHKAAEVAVAESKEIFSRFGTQIHDFETSLKNLNAQLEELKRGLDVARSRSMIDAQHEPQKLVDEIEAIAKKISSDCETILGLRNEPKSTSQASRVALLHTKNLLPNLLECAKEMGELLRQTVEQKNAQVVRAADILQMVASVESQQGTLKDAVNSLRMSDQDWTIVDRITIVSDIPTIYGSLLIEAIRRHEWVDKMRRDSSNLAEEVAGYQEEEHRRRKKWLKSMKDIVPEHMDGAVLGLEINLHGEESAWPPASRKDLEEYLRSLQALPGLSEAIEFINEMIRELDKPTRQQVKRAKAFKNGSIHEAGFGKGSLLLRGEDEARVLKEVATKLEEELKSSKSRVRKLEDLLHRQSQLSRMSVTSVSPSQNGLYQEAGPVPEFPDRTASASPRPPEAGSRRPSMASRRFSNQPSEDKVSARRVVQLEAQLAEQKLARTALEKDLQDKDIEIQTIWTQLEEATSTKKDIMENMESKQKEFGDERKALEDEIEKLKLKVEEADDEMDRLLGSRDNERNGSERRIDEVMAELDQARRDSTARVRSLEDKLKDQRSDTDRRDNEVKEYLTNILSALSPNVDAPLDFTKLMRELEETAHQSAEQAKELTQAVALARSENDSIQSSLDSQKAEVSSLAMKLDSRESDITKAQEDLAAERAKAASIEAQLEEERTHLQDLRAKFTDGETGSESLRQRLAEEEAKVTDLGSKLAEAKSHINSLDVGLISLQSRHRALEASSRTATTRLDERAQRAKEITHRLYKQNDRLFGLLETLGFAVIYEKDSMTIQRASKISNSSVLGEQSTLLHVQQSASTPAKKLLADLSDLSSLLWMEKESPKEEESKFTEFVGKIDQFNLDTFCEAIAKRMRDIEHTARKWQREARAYRDKSRKYQSDSHEKIAYRGFKEGDLALFLPTRNQITRPWAAFNVGAPHYFLREQDGHRLANKDWLVARITKVEERIVDLSKTVGSTRAADGRSIGETSEGGASIDDDNPFDLSDGLRWYMLDAQEEKAGAPSTPGLGKATVSAANVDAQGSIRMLKKKPGEADEVSRQLSKSLDSRRSSVNSKKSGQLAPALGIRKPGSDEALADTPENASSPPKSLGIMGHLRSTSQASSLRNVQNSAPSEGQATNQNHEEEGQPAESHTPTSPLAEEPTPSPSKSRMSPSRTNSGGPVESPSKARGRSKGGLWDSLWQFDLSLESGSKKK